MNKIETWEKLLEIGVVEGPMVKGKWDLSNVNLSGADLSGADLTCAVLDGTELSSAYLTKADLHGLYLGSTDLRGANLNLADLSKADLNCTDLNDADLSGAYLCDADFHGAQLIGAELIGANLIDADISSADLTMADLREANLIDADLSASDLRQTDLRRANLTGANLTSADLTDANLCGANLSNTHLVGVNFSGAKLNGCRIYGASIWNVCLQGAEQTDLIITPEDEQIITVDNLKLAQFIHLLLNNPEIRDIIDTITSKVVLILGRFEPERKLILDSLRNELRKKNYTPILFDFKGPENRDITETICTLAHMARFVIADITDAKSVPQELMAFVPNLPSVPVQPMLQKTSMKYGTFEHFERYPWVLPVYQYGDIDEVMVSLSERLIFPAEAYKKKGNTQT